MRTQNGTRSDGRLYNCEQLRRFELPKYCCNSVGVKTGMNEDRLELLAQLRCSAFI